MTWNMLILRSAFPSNLSTTKLSKNIMSRYSINFQEDKEKNPWVKIKTFTIINVTEAPSKPEASATKKNVLSTTEYTAWKVPKYRFFSGPDFLIFGLNTEIYGVNLRIQSEYRKIRTRNNSTFGHFSRSGRSSQWK